MSQKWAIYSEIEPTVCSVQSPKCGTEIKFGDMCVEHGNSAKSVSCFKCGKEWGSLAWGVPSNPPSEFELSLPEAIPANKIPSEVKVEPTSKVINLTSFSVKNQEKLGINHKVDYVTKTRMFDIRKTVRNPWKDPVLRKLNGLDQRVQDYIARCPKSMKEVERIKYYTKTSWKNIYIGCFGGKHRSVAIVEMIAKDLRAEGFEVVVKHQDLKVKPHG